MPKKIMQQKINFLSIFPEIKRIQSRPLRKGVLRVWELAVQESGEGDLFSVPFNPEVKGASLVQHIQFVVKASLFIADQLKKAHGHQIDLDLLIASALLHDLGKIFEYRRQGGRFKKTEIGKFFPHGFWGAFLALREGLPLDLAHLVSSHAHVSPVPPRRLEGIILHYADFAHADALRFSQGLETFLERGKNKK
jgi:putative nucleotidyltransferase with HDIG domain